MVVVNEITAEEILIFVIVLIIFLIIITIMLLYPYISKTIHNSYHKGYNEARKDRYNYFESLRDLDDNFTKIMKEIKNKKLELHIGLVSDLLDFGNKIRKYKNKN